MGEWVTRCELAAVKLPPHSCRFFAFNKSCIFHAFEEKLLIGLNSDLVSEHSSQYPLLPNLWLNFQWWTGIFWWLVVLFFVQPIFYPHISLLLYWDLSNHVVAFSAKIKNTSKQATQSTTIDIAVTGIENSWKLLKSHKKNYESPAEGNSTQAFSIGRYVNRPFSRTVIQFTGQHRFGRHLDLRPLARGVVPGREVRLSATVKLWKLHVGYKGDCHLLIKFLQSCTSGTSIDVRLQYFAHRHHRWWFKRLHSCSQQ